MALTSTGAAAAAALALSSSSCCQRMMGWMPGLRFWAFCSSWAGLGCKQTHDELNMTVKPLSLGRVRTVASGFRWINEACWDLPTDGETCSVVTSLVLARYEVKIHFLVWWGWNALCSQCSRKWLKAHSLQQQKSIFWYLAIQFFGHLSRSGGLHTNATEVVEFHVVLTALKDDKFNLSFTKHRAHCFGKSTQVIQYLSRLQCHWHVCEFIQEPLQFQLQYSCLTCQHFSNQEDHAEKGCRSAWHQLQASYIRCRPVLRVVEHIFNLSLKLRRVTSHLLETLERLVHAHPRPQWVYSSPINQV